MRARNTRRFNFFTRFIIIIIIFATAIFFIDSRIRPIVKRISAYQGQKIASEIINQSVYDTLAVSNADIDNFINITYNQSGNVTSVRTNTSEINKLQSEISIAINSDIDNVSDTTVEINLGTFSGLTSLNDKGPIIKFKIQPVGFVKTELVSEFTSAGINQTLHKIILNINTTIAAIIPGNTTSFDVNLTYIIVETVIVGDIPEGYTYVTGDNRDTLTKTNDYTEQVN